MEDENLIFIKEALRKVEVPDQLMETIAKSMMEAGITKKLAHHVSETDLTSHGLNKYQAKEIVTSWQETPTKSGNTSIRALAEQPMQASYSKATSTLLHILNFRVDWQQIYKLKFKTKCAEDVLKGKQRPDPGLRRAIVAELVYQVTTKVLQPTRKCFDTVYLQLIERHPESFKETLGAGTECSGGILHQMKTKFDNDFQRPERNSNIRDPDIQRRLQEQPRGKFAYGCVRWRALESLNQSLEDEDSQKTMMKREHAETRSKFWKWDEIEEAMRNTYKSQRDLINKNIEDALAEEKAQKAKTRKRKKNQEEESNEVDDVEAVAEKVKVSDVYREWPFLFTYRGMVTHYSVLMAADLPKEFENFKKNKLENMIKFFEESSDDQYQPIINRMNRALQKHPDGDAKLRAVSLLLPCYFAEVGFIVVEEETATIESLESDRKTPIFPGLVAPAKHQNLQKAKKFFLGTDQEFFNSLTSFERAFCCVFMMHYVLNLIYPEDNQVTMEFIQRYVFNVDPVRGNRRPVKKGSKSLSKKTPSNQTAQVQFSTRVVHPKVSNLCIKLQDFQASNNKSDASIESSDDEDNQFGADHSDIDLD